MRGRVLAVSTLLLLLVLCGCQGLVNTSSTTPTTPATSPPATLQTSINHVIFMAQENRSFDTYFGQLAAYWAANGYPSQKFEGMPANASNPSYTGSTTPGTTSVNAFHLATECFENLSPSWDESHEDWNLQNATSSTPMMNGFVYNAAKFANDSGYTDVTGERAMGYYDWTDLPYYYFMASKFATSDNWFSPAMDRTQINRMYLFAATSQGYAYPPGTTTSDNHSLTAKTIFDALDAAKISWKIYATDSGCSAQPNGDNPSSAGYCTYLNQFQQFSTLPSNVVSASDFVSDANAGNLPSVSFIEPGYLSGQDEHPSSGTDVQVGASYVATLINGLMQSKSWKDSVFILTYDEAGGTYDHVPPVQMTNPDGIGPIDLASTDICAGMTNTSNPICNFEYTGYRVPLLVISPFTKKNYVSHTPADYTAILAFIEDRFGLPALTKRDAAQMNMEEFFDFQNAPWTTPPSNIPTQPTGGACNAQNLGYP